MNFVDIICKISFDPQKQVVCDFLATLLINLRMDSESDIFNPQFTECICSILDRFHPIYLVNFKITEFQAKLVASALCLSGREKFLARFDEIFQLFLLRIREKMYSSEALASLNLMLETYYTKYSDSWATLLERSESIVGQLFPDGRKNVIGCEESVKGVVKILETVTLKIPRFSCIEVIKRLLKQCSKALPNGQSIDNFPWDRANIALQTYLFLCSMCTTKQSSAKAVSWKPEYSQIRIGDFELESIDSEVVSLTKALVHKICKQFWQPNYNEMIINANRTKFIGFLVTVLTRFVPLIDSRSILKFTEARNIPEIGEAALEAWNMRFLDVSEDKQDEDLIAHELVHKISNMIYGQTFRLTSRIGTQNYPVYNYFEKCFSAEESLSDFSDPPQDFQENEILRGGIFFLLESLNAWSQTKLLESASSIKLSSAEIELFGKVVDVYFKILSKYESLVKAVYLERQGDRNILLRSWSSLVGFKRNSKEIADFIVSILGYSDENLRKRVIGSFRHLPMDRMSEFMKLCERFRLVVSEDFVKLKLSRKNRRNDKRKIEVTQLYRNVLMAWNLDESVGHQSSALTPLKMILRHIVELYYYVSKIELVDDFLWKLREEFVSLLSQYLVVVNSMSSNLRKSFFPLKFHLEVWLTCDEWFYATKNDNSVIFCNMEGLFVNLGVFILTAVSSIDRASLPNFIENLLIKIYGMTDGSLQSQYAYNLLSSSRDEEHFGLLIETMIGFLGCRGDGIMSSLQKGIQLFLTENPEITDSTSDPSLVLFRLMHGDSTRPQAIQSNDPDILVKVIDLLQSISDATIQRRVLFRLQGPLSEAKIDGKIIQMLLKLSERLLETFPNSLKYLWQTLVVDMAKRELCVGLIVHELMNCLQMEPEKSKPVVMFVYSALDESCREYLLETLLQYSHPFSGTQTEPEFSLSPIQAVLLILTENRMNEMHVKSYESAKRIKVLFILFEGDEVCDGECGGLVYEEILMWAVECPVNEISTKAWKLLKDFFSAKMSSDFIEMKLLSSATRFLQHLVCPATLNYFDPLLVGQVLRLFTEVVLRNEGISSALLNEIFGNFLIQLSALDQVVHEETCVLLQTCFENEKFSLEHQEQKDCEKLLLQLLNRTENEKSMEFLFFILEREVNCSEALGAAFSKLGTMTDRFMAYLVGLLPFLFSFFEAHLNHSTSQSAVGEKVEEYEEMRYLHLLILFCRSLLVEEGQVDDNGRLCVLELEQFLVSIEHKKLRSSIDFYKAIASLLSDPFLRLNSLKTIEKSLESLQHFQDFLVFFFDSLRIGGWKISSKEDGVFAFKVANLLATSNDEKNCELRQRVIDFLVD
jgi:hypothetical protein